MPAGQWFWIIYVIIGVMGGCLGPMYIADRRWFGGGLVVFILIGLLGWGIFGSPISSGR